jgi:enoyl-CoA hydratase/carnithine racemase
MQVTELGDGLRLVRFNRPEKLNALSREAIQELDQVLLAADAEPTVRGIVLAGAGPSFCAGVDLREFATASSADANRLIVALQHACRTLRWLSKPVACAIQGHCLGGALELAACCDLRVCASDARLGMTEVFLGIPSVIDAVMLQHLVGVGRAHELLLTGDSISAETAERWGLVHRVVAAERLLDETTQVLRRVTRHAPEAVASQKRLHQRWLEMPYEAAVGDSLGPFLDAFGTGRPQQIATARLARTAGDAAASP